MLPLFFILHALFISNPRLIVNAPTNTSFTLLRGSVGAFGEPRGNGKTHAGIDIVANQSSPDKIIYSVFAVNAGTVAYARINGSDTTGYGYTIIIDHGDGNYSQYSHLAIHASSGIVKPGDRVIAGQLIGYLADLQNGEKSSGNVLAEVVKTYDKIQLHFECFYNKAGITSDSDLKRFHANGGFLIDPTAQLKTFHYDSF